MDGMSCRGFSSSQSTSMEDYPVRQRRNSLSPQSQRTRSYEHGVGGLFVHSLPRTYDTVGAPYPPASPRQTSTTSAGDGDGGRADFPFYAYRHEGQQVVMGGAGNTPTKQLSPFTSDRTCFPERPLLTSSTQLHGRGTPGYEEDEMTGPMSSYFLPTQFSYNSANHLELQARLTMQGDRNTPKRRRPDFDVMGDERDRAYCTCAVMEGNFLQMAECAYKRIRRLDSSPVDFERFRTELAQTNEILRESMGLMKRIREMCDHRPRSRP
ncbi:uncharacterized protein LOC112556768 isoform X3 [Pomacea canaliculata]|nr:uncharacterized protein LOC112556768 isoform X3 [Pomacea canaliculata]